MLHDGCTSRTCRFRNSILGNHETGPGPVFKYSEYINRIADAQWPLAYASGSASNRWFAFSVGQVAFVVFDTGTFAGTRLYMLVVDHRMCDGTTAHRRMDLSLCVSTGKAASEESRERLISLLPAAVSPTAVLPSTRCLLQWFWLNTTLAAINRTATPWLIAVGHRASENRRVSHIDLLKCPAPASSASQCTAPRRPTASATPRLRRSAMAGLAR